MSDSFATPWTIARQAPLSMGFSRQEYWNRLPFPPPGDLSDTGIELASPASPALAGKPHTSVIKQNLEMMKLSEEVMSNAETGR